MFIELLFHFMLILFYLIRNHENLLFKKLHFLSPTILRLVIGSFSSINRALLNEQENVILAKKSFIETSKKPISRLNINCGT